MPAVGWDGLCRLPALDKVPYLPTRAEGHPRRRTASPVSARSRQSGVRRRHGHEHEEGQPAQREGRRRGRSGRRSWRCRRCRAEGHPQWSALPVSGHEPSMPPQADARRRRGHEHEQERRVQHEVCQDGRPGRRSLHRCLHADQRQHMEVRMVSADPTSVQEGKRSGGPGQLSERGWRSVSTLLQRSLRPGSFHALCTRLQALGLLCRHVRRRFVTDHCNGGPRGPAGYKPVSTINRCSACPGCTAARNVRPLRRAWAAKSARISSVFRCL